MYWKNSLNHMYTDVLTLFNINGKQLTLLNLR